jgi:hypothetical protein
MKKGKFLGAGNCLDESKRTRAFIVQINNNVTGGLRIQLSKYSGFKPGQKIYQVLRADGVLLLIPEELFNLADYQ